MINKLILFSAMVTLVLATTYGAMATENEKHGDGKHKPGPGRLFEKMDADGDGTVTKAEHKEFSDQKFKELDANGDGNVSTEEATAMRDKKHAEREAKRQERSAEQKKKAGDTAPEAAPAE